MSGMMDIIRSHPPILFHPSLTVSPLSPGAKSRFYENENTRQNSKDHVIHLFPLDLDNYLIFALFLPTGTIIDHSPAYTPDEGELVGN